MSKRIWPMAVVVLCTGLSAAADAASTRSNDVTPVQRPAIADLALAQRMSLPDATLVVMARGRVVSLGTLRAEHVARVARFEKARAKPVGDDPAAELPHDGKLVEMKPVKSGPADYKAYCNSIKTSGCLFLPPNTYLSGSYPTLEYWDDWDPFITGNICTLEGGKPHNSGCLYQYPSGYDASFYPGAPPPGQPIGAGVTWAKQCTTNIFNVNVNTHGSIKMLAVGKATPVPPGYVLELNTGATIPKCFVKVYIPN